MKKGIFIILLSLVGSILFAQTTPTLLLKDRNELLLAGKKSSFLLDKQGKLTIEDILKPENQKKFASFADDIPFFSEPESYHWIKLRVKRQIPEPTWVELGTSVLFYIDYYRSEAGQYQLHTQTGAFRPAESKAFPSNLFWFPLSDSLKEETVYFRIYVSGVPLSAPLKVGSLSSLSKDKNLSDHIFGAFMGIVLIMFGYNLFLLLALRDRIYRWYLCYLLMLLVYIPFINNYPLVADWFEDNLRPYWYQYFLTWHAPLYVFISSFSIEFLDFRKKYSSQYRYIIGLTIIISGIIPLLNLFNLLPFFVLWAVHQIFTLIFYLSLLLVAVYLGFRDKNKNAIYYSLAWCGFIVSIFVVIFAVSGILPLNYLTRNSTFFGASWEILMFSFALADKINTLRRQKATAQKKLLVAAHKNQELIKEQNIVLEEKVRTRTEKLVLANKELSVSNEELNATLQVVHNQKEIIEIKNKKINASINYAKRIQDAMMPAVASIQADFPSLFILYMPRDIVSGDFYWYAKVNDKKILAAVDCTGHGVPGAFMSMLSYEILNHVVKGTKVVSPDEILHHLHIGIRTALKQEATQNRDGMDMAICSVNAQGNEIVFAGAKNPLIYVKNDELIEIKGSRSAIGGVQKKLEILYTKHILKVDTFTSFFIFSDGYADQFGGEFSQKFLKKRFKKLLLEISKYPTETQCQKLKDTIEEWKRNRQQTDDILVMGFQLGLSKN